MVSAGHPEDNLLGRMQRSCDSGATLEIIDASGTQVRSYSDLLEDGRDRAAQLERVGVSPGARVAAIAHTSFDFVTALLGAWFAGCTFVPLAPPTRIRNPSWATNLRVRLETLGVEVLLGDADGFPSGRDGLSLTGATRSAGSVSPTSPPALIQFSSGTTGNARAVVLSHEALTANFVARMDRLRHLGPDLHAVSWLPLYHDMGLIIYLLHPLASGTDATMMTTDLFVREPLRWLRLIDDRQATHSSAPNFAYGLVARKLEADPPGSLDLSSWRHATLGGEFIDPEVLTSFEEAARRYGFAEGALAPAYGLAEATCTATLVAPGERYVIDEIDRRALVENRAEPATSSSSGRTARFVSVGSPLNDTEIRIGGPEHPLEERRIGEILIKAPYLMSGYLDDPTATDAALSGGWLRTGDLGYVVGDDLFVTGRLKDVVVVRGQTFHAEDVERVLQKVPGVRPGRIAVLPRSLSGDERFVVAAESRLVDEEQRSSCRREIQRCVWREMGVGPSGVLLLPPGTLPRTSSGKLQRRRAADLVRQELSVEQ